MDIFEELEYPLPVLKVDIDKIVLETYKDIKGKFNIYNIGGSVLMGQIISNTSALKFEKDFFEGNKIEISYFIDVSSLKTMEYISDSFTIISNGGEKTIEVHIKVTSPFLLTKLDTKINNLKDFYEFTIKNPVEARFLFSSQDFMFWLFEIGYENMELYEHFIKDPNKERGLDSFLRANNLSRLAEINFEQTNYEVKIDPLNKFIVPHTVNVTKNAYGYIKTKLKVKNASPWLILETKDVSSLDFENKDFKEINFYINNKLVTENYVRDSIILEEYNKSLTVEVFKKNLIKTSLSKTSFVFDDIGFLIIENNYGKDISLEVIPSNNFIKFDGKKYFVGKNAEIPFNIRVSAFQIAQMTFRKQMVLEGNIVLRAFFEDRVIKTNLELKIGTLV